MSRGFLIIAHPKPAGKSLGIYRRCRLKDRERLQGMRRHRWWSHVLLWLVGVPVGGWRDGLLVASPRLSIASFLAALRLEPDAVAAPEIQFFVGGPESRPRVAPRLVAKI